MKPKVFTSVSDPELAAMITRGAIGVIPTDTVYGLVAQANNQAAIKKMYSVKKREHQAGTTIGASIDQFVALGFPTAPLLAAQQYWPASLSVVVNAASVPHYLKIERTALPVRIPSPPDLLTLLRQTGALMTSSANKPGEPTATNIKAAMDYFGDSVDFYVDAGDLGNRPPSTIIEFGPNHQLIIHRQGATEL